jgi:hypothetical protein
MCGYTRNSVANGSTKASSLFNMAKPGDCKGSVIRSAATMTHSILIQLYQALKARNIENSLCFAGQMCRRQGMAAATNQPPKHLTSASSSDTTGMTNLAASLSRISKLDGSSLFNPPFPLRRFVNSS